MNHMQGRVFWFDLVRGISAVAVMLGHLRLVVWPKYEMLHDPGALDRIAYFLTGFGNQAVLVFFVLSGYFVGGGVLASWFNPDPRNYMIARLTRLWVVLVPALVFTYAVDQWILNVAPHVLEFQGLRNFSSEGHAYVLHSDARVFIGNLLFLQTAAVPVLGCNIALWSLACEAWYYLAFPLMVWGVCGHRQRWTVRLAFLGMLMALLWLMPTKMLLLFPAWLMGAAIPLLTRHNREGRRRGGAWLATLLFIGALMNSRMALLTAVLPYQNELLLGLGSAIWLACLRRPSQHWVPEILLKPIKLLSESSYTLYLFHMPMVFLIAAWLVRSGANIMDSEQSWWLLILPAISILALAQALWFIFERRAPALRRWLAAITS